MTSLNQEIVSLLPGLRRYARAVTGDRHCGDRYIRIALEILAEEPWRIPSAHDIKFRLYRLFDDVLSILEPGRSDDSVDRADPYHRLKHGVLGLPLLSRKLLLLVSVERFPLSRAAELLHMPVHDAEVQLAGARTLVNDLAATLREPTNGAHYSGAGGLAA